MIKQRIESLIEREYLKRDDADRSKYIYLPWKKTGQILKQYIMLLNIHKTPVFIELVYIKIYIFITFSNISY